MKVNIILGGGNQRKTDIFQKELFDTFEKLTILNIGAVKKLYCF